MRPSRKDHQTSRHIWTGQVLCLRRTIRFPPRWIIRRLSGVYRRIRERIPQDDITHLQAVQGRQTRGSVGVTSKGGIG